MNTQESITSQPELEHSEKFSRPESAETRSTVSIQPYSLTLMDLQDSVKSLDESKKLTKELMNNLKESSAPNDKQMLIRCAKEIRETMKVKLDIAKFAHIVGSNSKLKPEKETA